MNEKFEKGIGVVKPYAALAWTYLCKIMQKLWECVRSLPGKVQLGLAVLVLLALVCLFWGVSGPSAIDIVQNAGSPIDKTITTKAFFANYKYARNGKWDITSTDSGQKCVEFRAEYTDSDTVQKILRSLYGKTKIDLEDMAEYAIDKGSKIYFVVQFAVNGNAYQTVYAGLKYKDKKAAIADARIREIFARVADNESLDAADLQAFPKNAFMDDLAYLCNKYLIEKYGSDLKKQQYADSAKVKHPDGYVPQIYFVSIEKFDFDDSTQSITVHANLYLTDVPEEGKKQTSSDLKDHIIKTIPVELIHDTAERTENFRTVAFRSPKDIYLNFRIYIEDQPRVSVFGLDGEHF